MGIIFNIFTSVIRHANQVILKIIKGTLRHYDPQPVFTRKKAVLGQALLPRLMASRFPPASKRTGIQRDLL